MSTVSTANTRSMASPTFSARGVCGLALALSIAALAACGGGSGESATDTSVAAGATAGADSMAGMDHSNMPGISATPARDADQEFLRMMVDHHEGLIQMLDVAMEKATSPQARADAKEIHDKQHEEQERMIGMLRSSYDETKEPMVMPSNAPMVRDLQDTPASAGYDTKMYQHIIMHHQEGIRMMNDFLPRLTKQEVRQMAERMRADQQREMQELERKVS